MSQQLKVGQRVTGIIVIKGRCFAYSGRLSKISKRWWRKPKYLIDGTRWSKQIIRVETNETQNNVKQTVVNEKDHSINYVWNNHTE